jgi:trk system potassium uptake protein
MKFCVIGLGRFGKQVSLVLSENGAEVVAIDSNQSLVNAVRDEVTKAICTRITDEASLRSIGIEDMDTVIVAIGESFSQSVLITALLKKRLKIPYVIARAIDSVHHDVLALLGADRIVLPEQEIGTRLADNLSSALMDFIRITHDFGVGEIIAPHDFIGKSIQDLQLFDNYNVYCIGKKFEEEAMPLDQEYTIEEHDRLLVAGLSGDLQKLAKLR